MNGFLCRLLGHRWVPFGGACTDGTLWVNERCARCAKVRNESLAQEVSARGIESRYQVEVIVEGK